MKNSDKTFEPRPRPFINWDGDKTGLVEIIKILAPVWFKTYYEPFLGNGAVFLILKPDKAFLSNKSSELINAWLMLQTDSDSLIKQLDQYIERHSVIFYRHLKTVDSSRLSSIESAARLIYLSKIEFDCTLLNLLRIDSKAIYHPINIEKIVRLLVKKNVEINCATYKEMIDSPQTGDFVFTAPPVLGQNKLNWKEDDLMNLIAVLKNWDKAGVKWMFVHPKIPAVTDLLKNYQKLTLKVRYAKTGSAQTATWEKESWEAIYINYDLTAEQYFEVLNYLNRIDNKLDEHGLVV